MKSLTYNVELTQGDHGRWFASCQEPMLPTVDAATRQRALSSVYNTIFDDLKGNIPIGSLELRVNIIEGESD